MRTREEHLERMRQYAKVYRQNHKYRLKPSADVTDHLYAAPIITKPEKVIEALLEIEEKYCIVFACGKKLSLREKLFGNKCLNHANKS